MTVEALVEAASIAKIVDTAVQRERDRCAAIADQVAKAGLSDAHGKPADDALIDAMRMGAKSIARQIRNG